MRFPRSRRRLGVIVSIITAVGFLLLFLRWQSTPFAVGSKVDDVWDHIHTDAVSDGFSGSIVPVNKRIRWIANATSIRSETRFSWRNTAFVTQKTIYSCTNGTITGANSDWELHWPFSK